MYSSRTQVLLCAPARLTAVDVSGERNSASQTAVGVSARRVLEVVEFSSFVPLPFNAADSSPAPAVRTSAAAATAVLRRARLVPARDQKRRDRSRLIFSAAKR